MKPNLIYTVIIFCASFLLYAQAIGFDFSHMDDDTILIKNKAYFESKTDVKRIFTTDPYLRNTSNFYRPLQALSYWVDVVISGGLHARMFHLTNIVLFGIIGCLLFYLLLTFNISVKIAFYGTLIFCVHPLFVTAVAWIPARGDLLLTLFCVLSFIYFKKFTETGKIIYIFPVWLAFTIALFSKETAAFLPFVLLVYYLTVAKCRKINLKYILLGLLVGISGLFWFYLRNLFATPLEQITINRVLANFATIPVAFSQLIAIPFDFSPMPAFTATKIIIGFLVLTLICYLVFKNTKRPFRENLFYILWFLLFLLPTFWGISTVDKIDYLDHRFLLPMIGILLLATSAFSNPAKQTEDVKTFGKTDFLWIGAVMVLSMVTFYKTDVYRNAENYYGAIIKYSPQNSALAHNNRGMWKTLIGNMDGAMDDFNQAITHNQAYALAYFNRGLLKIGYGDLTGALNDYNQAFYHGKTDATTHFQRGFLKANMGDVAGALDDYNRAIAQEKDFAFVYFNRSLLKYQIGDISGAIDDFNHAISIDIKFADAFNSGLNQLYDIDEPIYYNIRGMWKGQSNDFAGALADFDLAIQKNDKFVDAYTNRAAANNMMGNINRALDDVNTALRIDSSYIKAYYNRAVLYRMLNDYEKALQDCEKILEINPNDELVIGLKKKLLE